MFVIIDNKDIFVYNNKHYEEKISHLIAFRSEKSGCIGRGY